MSDFSIFTIKNDKRNLEAIVNNTTLEDVITEVKKIYQKFIEEMDKEEQESLTDINNFDNGITFSTMYGEYQIIARCNDEFTLKISNIQWLIDNKSDDNNLPTEVEYNINEEDWNNEIITYTDICDWLSDDYGHFVVDFETNLD